MPERPAGRAEVGGSELLAELLAAEQHAGEAELAALSSRMRLAEGEASEVGCGPPQPSSAPLCWLGAEELPAVDLATLLGEMAALKAEVRAETLAAREQREALQQVQLLLRDELRRSAARAAELAAELRRLQQEQDRARARLIIELWDRLVPARQTAATLAEPGQRKPWWRLPWWKSDETARRERAASALAEGLRLTLQRMDEQLAELGVERIAPRPAGDSFDPRLMKAVEVAERPDLPEGTVVATVLPGYREREGSVVLRSAQVVVSRVVRPEQTDEVAGRAEAPGAPSPPATG